MTAVPAGRRASVTAGLVAMALLVAGCAARAGPLRDICDFAYDRLSSVPGTRLNRSTGRFTAYGRSPRGVSLEIRFNPRL